MKEFFEAEPVVDEKLDTIGKLVKELEQANADVKLAELALKEKKEAQRVLAQEVIPASIQSTGFSELRLLNGTKVTIKDEIKAEIPKGRVNEAYHQMVQAKLTSDTGYTEQLATAMIDELFKSTLVIDIPTKDVEQLLMDNRIIFSKPRSIHWATLRKYCEDTEGRGEKIPDLINVFKFKSTKLEKKK